jgi:hypothetical protein
MIKDDTGRAYSDFPAGRHATGTSNCVFHFNHLSSSFLSWYAMGKFFTRQPVCYDS